MPFNSAYDVSLRCTHFSNKAALYNDSIFQALCLNQIVCDIFEDVFIAVLRKYEYDRDFLWKQRTILETDPLLCFALSWFHLLGSICIIISPLFFCHVSWSPSRACFYTKQSMKRMASLERDFACCLKLMSVFKQKYIQADWLLWKCWKHTSITSVRMPWLQFCEIRNWISCVEMHWKVSRKHSSYWNCEL